MNCRDLEEKLPYLAGGVAPSMLLAAAEDHARSCPSCARLLAAARGEPAWNEAEPPDELFRSILARTKGAVCPQLGDRLIGWVDGELDDLDRSLLAEHLAHCPECTDLVGELTHLVDELPRLAEVEPDVRFVADVLERTSWADAAQRRARTRSRPPWWRRVIERPRSALEIACGLAFLISLLTSAPSELVRELAVRPGHWIGAAADSSATEPVAGAIDLASAAARLRAGINERGIELAAVPGNGTVAQAIELGARCSRSLDRLGRSLRRIGGDLQHRRWSDAWREAVLLGPELSRTWSSAPPAGTEDRGELRDRTARISGRNG